MDNNNNTYSINEWYSIMSNWRNQKYYAPSTINLASLQQTSTSTSGPQSSSSNITNLVSGAFSQILSDDNTKDHHDGTDTDNKDDQDKDHDSSNSISGITANATTSSTSTTDTSSASFIIIETLLRSLKFEKDDIFRINLLLFLQEHSSILLEDDLKRFERVFTILQSLIFSQTDSYPVKSQVLTTITTILICESIIKTNTKYIEIFIELLLEIISKINNSPDRLLRGSACNCLLEFELTYPCILSEFKPLVMNYCQLENTHLIQNYTVLLTTILSNITLNAYEEANSVQNTIILNGGSIGQLSSSSTSSQSNTVSSIASPMGSMHLNTIISPNTNTLSLPISPINQQQQQQQIPSSHSSHSSMRSLINQQQQQQQSIGINGNSSQNSLNYGSSRRSTLLPLPNIFTDQDSSVGRNTTSFVIPLNVKFSPISLERINSNNELFHRSRTSLGLPSNGNTVKLQDSFEKEVFKCASAIADQSAYLNQWGLTSTIQQLIPLIDLVNIPHNFFKNHLHLLYKLFFTYNTVQFHIVLYLTLNFPDLYSQDELDYCLKRLISITNDISTSIENRILAIDWLLSLPMKLKTNFPNNPNSISIFQFYSNFYPTSFDSIQLKESKLYTLCKCLSLAPTGFNFSPDELIKSLICLEEFKHGTEQSLSTRIVFSCCLLFLSTFPIQMFDSIEKYLSDILINYPQNLNVVISLLNGIGGGGANKTRINLFLSLSKTILQLKPIRFLQYLPLVERIVVEDTIDPTALLEKTFELVKRKKICTSPNNWVIGNIILSICRKSLMYHQTSVVAKPLKMILSNLFAYFSNLEIRDRASFYIRLISHLPDDKIKTVLNTLQNDEVNVSGLLSSTTPSADKNKLIKLVPNFISISQILNKSISNSIENIDNGGNGNDDNGVGESEFDIDFKNYLSILNESNKLEAKIIIPYQIRYKKHIVNHSNSTNSIGSLNSGSGSVGGIPMKVYALLIQLQQSPYYSEIHPIRIPYLCHPNNDIIDNYQNNNYSIEQQELKYKEFPYCYDIDLSFIPIYPVPTSFSIKMIFNDDEGKTCKSEGSLISIQLENLFMNNPTPPNLKSKSVNQFQLSLFEQLWSTSLNDKYQIEMTNSVKQININRNQILEILNCQLSNYLILDEEKKEIPVESSTTTTTQEIEILKCLIYLPPRFHLLLKFEIGIDSTIIYIKTDYWRCLVYLDQYLSNLTNSLINNNNNIIE